MFGCACLKRKCHIRTHTDEKLFVFPNCDKSFFRLDNLHIHHEEDKVEKPYLCSMCGKAFSNSGSTNGHRYIHREEQSNPAIA